MADTTTNDTKASEAVGRAARLLAAPDGPSTLMALALARLEEADVVMTNTVGDPIVDDLERAMFSVEMANALRGIAEVAHTLQVAEPAPHENKEASGRPSLPPEVPQAVRGVRFVVRYVGHDMGTAVWVPRLAAFVPKLGFAESAALDGDRAIPGQEGCDIVLVAAGRVVSATGGMAMVVTEQGQTLSLARHVADYTECADQ